jgi:hypothetical protein
MFVAPLFTLSVRQYLSRDGNSSLLDQCTVSFRLSLSLFYNSYLQYKCSARGHNPCHVSSPSACKQTVSPHIHAASVAAGGAGAGVAHAVFNCPIDALTPYLQQTDKCVARGFGPVYCPAFPSSLLPSVPVQSIAWCSRPVYCFAFPSGLLLSAPVQSIAQRSRPVYCIAFPSGLLHCISVRSFGSRACCVARA